MEDGTVRCDLCPRHCLIKEGKRGFCYVREVIGGDLYLTTYGRSSGFCIDPIEKKPLNHYYPGTPILSFGTAGCNLACKFCQNWDISRAQQTDRLNSEAMPEQIVKMAKDNNCHSIAFTYNEPIIFMEYARDTALLAHQEGIKTVAVTAGYITEAAREEFFSFIDAANVDLKSFSEDFYKKLTGASLAPILDNLKYLKDETNVWFEITTLLIPGHNDSTKEIDQMTSWIVDNLGVDVPLHFSAFHPDYKMVDVAPTPLKTLTHAREIALSKGIRYVYTGNVHDTTGSSTYCHNCHEMLIGRDWYQLSTWNLDKDGNCKKCGTKCSGVFEEHPGSWGPQRRAI